MVKPKDRSSQTGGVGIKVHMRTRTEQLKNGGNLIGEKKFWSEQVVYQIFKKTKGVLAKEFIKALLVSPHTAKCLEALSDYEMFDIFELLTKESRINKVYDFYERMTASLDVYHLSRFYWNPENEGRSRSVLCARGIQIANDRFASAPSEIEVPLQKFRLEPTSIEYADKYWALWRLLRLCQASLCPKSKSSAVFNKHFLAVESLVNDTATAAVFFAGLFWCEPDCQVEVLRLLQNETARLSRLEMVYGLRCLVETLESDIAGAQEPATSMHYLKRNAESLARKCSETFAEDFYSGCGWTDGWDNVSKPTAMANQLVSALYKRIRFLDDAVRLATERVRNAKRSVWNLYSRQARVLVEAELPIYIVHELMAYVCFFACGLFTDKELVELISGLKKSVRKVIDSRQLGSNNCVSNKKMEK